MDSEGDLYASSAGASKILVFSPSDHVTPIAEVANANEPCALAVTSTGTLYVSEQATGEVVRYAPAKYPFEGAPSYEGREVIDASGEAKGIAVDPFDDRLYVAEDTHVSVYGAAGNLGINETQEVRCFLCTGGKYKLEFGGEATKSINFEGEPSEVKEALEELASIGSGNVSVTNGANKKIHLVTFEGKLDHTDVEALKCIPEGLEGSGEQQCKVTELTKGWSGRIGAGDLTQATGVAPYTYKANSSQIAYHLAVADASGNQLKLFSAKSFTEQKLRQILDGPAEGEEFGFGAKGAYLGADKGTCPPSGGKACTAGHIFVYDDAHEALDELEATGALVSQTHFGAADGEPSAFAIDRSGGEGNGTLYASSGAGAEARVLAYGALGAPSRPGPLAEQSLTLEKACSVAIDDYGNRYVAVGPEIKVYPPTGTKELTKFSTGTKSCRIAIDEDGNVYAVLQEKAFYFKPESYPPKEGTTYGAAVEVARQEEFGGEAVEALAINPASGHLFALDYKQVIEYDSAANGSKPLNKEFAAGLGLPTMFGIAVDGATGNVYITNSSGSGSVYVVDPTGKELLIRITGAGSPKGSLGANAGAVAVDESNGHVISFAPDHKDLEEFEAAGTFVAAFGSFEELATFNYGVAVDNGAFSPNKGDVYLAYDDPKALYDLAAFGPLSYPPTPKHKLTLKKTGDGSGKVTSSPKGIDCGGDCTEEYEEGTGVVLSAKADPENEFTGWNGCEAEFEGTCEVTMQAATEVEAEFTNIGETFQLDVAIEGKGKVTSSPKGIDCEPTCSAPFGKNSTVTLTATPDKGSEVEAWEGCDEEPSQNQCEVLMDKDREVKLTYGPEHPLLSVIKEGTGSGKVTSTPAGIDCGSTCSHNYNLNEEVTLKAKAEEGSEFKGWEGCDEEPSPSECKLTLSEPRTVKATFTQLPQAIAKPPAPLTYTEATLRGEVLTAGLKTKYHFEYLTQAQYEKEGESFAGAQATPSGELEAAKALLAVFAKLNGLVKGTAYRFRLVVENEAGEATDEAAFTTLKETTTPPCPNAAYRTGPAANLPDCRAYELVSPPEDGGYTVGWIASGPVNSGFATALAAPNGESVVFETEGPLPGTEGNGVRNGYRAQRGASGWSSALYGPSGTQTSFPGAGGVSANGRYSFWAASGEEGSLDLGGIDARYLSLPAAAPSPACGPEAPSRFELIGCGSEGTDPEAIGRWISPGAEHVIFTSDQKLEPDAPTAKATIYDRQAGSEDAQVVSLLPENVTPSGDALYRGVSADGSAVAFDIGPTLYVRRENAQTFAVGTNATFAGLSRDGSILFYLQGGILRRFDVEAEAWAQIAPSGAFVNVPAGGGGAYFTSKEDLAAGAQAGKHNLYLWEAEGDVTRFIAILDPTDLSGTVNLGQWVAGLDPAANGVASGPAIDPSRTSADGQVIVFQSHAQLTGYESKGHVEVFRYEAATESLACISCGPAGTTASSDAQLQDESPGSPIQSALALLANLSEDGSTAFFTSAEPLLPADRNGVADVYEWREGVLSLISSGQSSYSSYLYGVSASGDDAFFATREALVAGDDEDDGSQSIYDARVNGGFPPPVEKMCDGEACLAPPTAPPELNPPPATAFVPPEPNTNNKHRKCAKGKRRVRRAGRVHCTRKRRAKKHRRHARQRKHRRGQKPSR